MNRAEVELRVHRAISDTLAGKPVEDDFVELKSAWPTEFQRAARQIAAGANAAGSEPILWVIGVDEKAHTVPGASTVDPASWYPQIRAHFAENWAPEVDILNIPRDDKVVVALLFKTDGAPYLVRTDSDRLEVPWRSATRVRSAKRHELMSMVGDVVHVPDVDIIDVTFTAQVNRVQPPGSVIAHTFNATFRTYVTPRSNRVVHLPFYRTKMTFQPSGGGEALDLGILRVKLFAENGSLLRMESEQVSVSAPTFLTFVADKKIPGTTCPEETGILRCVLGPAGSTRSVSFQTAVQFDPTTSTIDYKRWIHQSSSGTAA